MGGGTGSGLGSYVLEALADEYPRTIRFATAVFPSESDDVVTSPYNTVLAAAELAEHATVAMPLQNAALAAMVDHAEGGATPHAASGGGGRGGGSGGRGGGGGGGRGGGGGGGGGSRRESLASNGPASRARAFDGMNNLVAHMLTSLTASVRLLPHSSTHMR